MADAAPGVRAPRLTTLLLTALLAGCASGGERWWPQAAVGTPDLAAVWGLPETQADAGLSCTGETVTVWLASDAPLAAGKPVSISAGTATLAVSERFVVDGIGAAEFDIPLASPLAAAIAGGARELRFAWHTGPGRLPLGTVPRRLVRDCRAGRR